MENEETRRIIKVDIIAMDKLRWDSYVLIKGADRINNFFLEHLKSKTKSILYVMGKGFDVRMNEGIKLIAQNHPGVCIKCLLVEYDEGPESTSKDYVKFVEANLNELKSLQGLTIEEKKISLWKGRGRNKRRIGDKKASDVFSSYDDISNFTEIIVDISALPRGIYFSLIGKLLTLIDKYSIIETKTHNLFILTSENAKIDQLTNDEDIDNDLRYSFGFGGELELTYDNPVIWFPVLGENKRNQIILAHDKIDPHEICPLLPFPAKDPRRSDALIIEYHRLLFDELRIEPQNLLYVPEQNPFEVYRSLSKAIINYNKTLSVLKGCKAAISTFSSKLLSLGALMTAYELNSRIDKNKIGVGILNVDSSGYKLEDKESLRKINSDSELFLTWLTGEPYII